MLLARGRVGWLGEELPIATLALQLAPSLFTDKLAKYYLHAEGNTGQSGGCEDETCKESRMQQETMYVRTHDGRPTKKTLHEKQTEARAD